MKSCVCFSSPRVQAHSSIVLYEYNPNASQDLQGIVKWYLLIQPHHHVVYLAFGICSLFLDLSHQEQTDNKDVDARMLDEQPKGFAFLSGSVPM